MKGGLSITYLLSLIKDVTVRHPEYISEVKNYLDAAGFEDQKIQEAMNVFSREKKVSEDSAILVYLLLRNQDPSLPHPDTFIFKKETATVIPLSQRKPEDFLEELSIDTAYDVETKAEYLYATQRDVNYSTYRYVKRYLSIELTKYEKKYKKPVSEFGRKEIMDLLSDISPASFPTVKFIYTSYLEWIAYNKKRGIDAHAIIKTLYVQDIVGDEFDYKVFQKRYFMSLEEVLSILENWSGEVILDSTINPMACLSWEGFTAREMLKIKNDNYSKIKKSIFFRNRETKVSDVTAKIIEKRIAEYGAATVTDTIVSMTLKHDASFGLDNIRGNFSRIATGVARNNPGTKMVTLSKIVESGRNMRVYEYEQQNGEVDWLQQMSLFTSLTRMENETSTKVQKKVREYYLWREYMKSAKNQL